MGKQWKQWETLFSWAPQLLQIMTIAMKSKAFTPWKKSYDQPRQHIKKQRHYFAKNGLVRAMVFPVVMYGCELDHKESWVLKNWCFWAVVLEKTLESPWQGDQTSQSKRKSTLNIHWKDWCWSWNSNTLATYCEDPTHWERLMLGKTEGKGVGCCRGWDS